MTKFNADEIASVLQAEIEQYDSNIDVREVGTVLEVGDGIARVHGLSGVRWIRPSPFCAVSKHLNKSSH